MENPPQRAILIVEDHAQTSHIMARLVSARGFKVLTAGSLAEARECVRQGNVGFLISDLGLPDGNGCELMAELRDRFGIKGAAITGFGMDTDLAQTLQAGFTLHLTKPISATDLERVLAQARIELTSAGESPRQA
jgi:CheY-like chemotaxis protein